MKILLVSDTHKSTDRLEALLEKYANDVKIVCHMGDHAEDLLQFGAKYPQLALVAVAGNCDSSPHLQTEIILQISACLDDPAAPQKKIMLVHGHAQDVKRGLARLLLYSKGKGVDAVFFGHTHFAICLETDGIFVMNPGSPSCPHMESKASYGLVEISPEGKISGELRHFQ